MAQQTGEEGKFGLSSRQLAELMDFHDRSAGRAGAKVKQLGGVPGIASQLDTNVKGGLPNNTQELELRRKVFGKNYIDPVPPKSFVALMLDAVQDKVLLVLMGAAFISIILNPIVANDEEKPIAWIDGVAILLAVAIVVLVTAVNDYTKERQFRGLQEKLATTSKYTVIRDTLRVEVVAADVVTGDIVEFKTGNMFPCDGLFIHGSDVVINEAALTGETLGLKKHADKDIFLYGGTQVMEGTGSMLATAVGSNSQQGIIFDLLSSQAEQDDGFIVEALKNCWACTCKKIRRKPVVDQESNSSMSEEKNLRDQDKEEDEDEEEEEQLGCCQRFWCFCCLRKKRKALKKKKEQTQEKKSHGSVLQNKLTKLALQIGYFAVAAAVVCFTVLLLKFCIEEYGIKNRGWEQQDASTILVFFINGITVLVVAIPEGLPLAVTIALAYSVKKMLRDNNLVRHLHSCETMGNATCICSDKTGTLTTNKMTVVDSYLEGRRYPDAAPPSEELSTELLDALKMVISVNSSYSTKLDILKDGNKDLHKSWITKGAESLRSVFRRKSEAASEGVQDDKAPEDTEEHWKEVTDLNIRIGRFSQIGNATESALLGLLVEMGIDYRPIRLDHPVESFVKVFTFNSNRKSMSTVVRYGSGFRLLTKGASEIVLNRCTHILQSNGQVVELSEDDKKQMLVDVVEDMAQNALRTIALAYRDFPASYTNSPAADDAIEVVSEEAVWDNEAKVVSNLTLVGIVGIEDPVRPEVPKSIKQCQQSGITVRMVTGDNVETARAIAEKCGIITRGDRSALVMEGRIFKKKVIDDQGIVIQEQLDKYWPRLRVLARSSPQDKYTLVEGIISSRLTRSREVVAVTGDGTNDGPALKRANVGFAMGIAGTDVAKEASDIILTDDNFASIVKAVKWGRNVYDSVSKFLQFQLTVNVVAVVLVLLGSFTIGDTPLRTIQLLWVNLIMDTFASLALATEEPTDDLLKRKPYGRKKPLISWRMLLFIGGHSVYQLAVLIVILYHGPYWFDIPSGNDDVHNVFALPTQHYTIIFNTFVLMQIVNEVNARKIHGEQNVFAGIHRNWLFVGIMFFQVAFQVLWVEVPFVSDRIFKTTGLDIDQWMWCLFLASVELVWGQILTLIPMEMIPDWKGPPCKPQNDVPEDVDDFDTDDLLEPTRARALWLKSLNRLRAQIRVVNAFKSAVDPAVHIQYPSTPRPARYYGDAVPTEHTGTETEV